MFQTLLKQLAAGEIADPQLCAEDKTRIANVTAAELSTDEPSKKVAASLYNLRTWRRATRKLSVTPCSPRLLVQVLRRQAAQSLETRRAVQSCGAAADFSGKGAAREGTENLFETP